MLTLCATEHARLKDHVASMNGGLEAKIHEGGKHHPSHCSYCCRVPLVCDVIGARFLAAFFCPSLFLILLHHPRTFAHMSMPVAPTSRFSAVSYMAASLPIARAISLWLVITNFKLHYRSMAPFAWTFSCVPRGFPLSRTRTS
jgi:hypothetical protein